MRATIRKHLRDFLALAGLSAIALVTVYVILQQQRLRIPILEQKPFTLKAEFQTAQAVTPGQGQTVVVAGVKIGDISSVALQDGKAVVTMSIERKFLPIYRNATAFIRPRTGLQDVFIELDPGTKGAGQFRSGDTIPVANTMPEVNLDEILQALDGDTQAYLRELIVGAGQGLKGRSRDLGKLLGGLGPINKELAQLNTQVAQRRQNLAHLIHNLNVLTGTIGQHGNELAQLVDSSNAALGAIAREDSHVQEAVRLLGPTLTTAHSTLVKTQPFAQLLGPTFNHLRPFARNLDRLNASVRRVSATKPVIRNEIRPFVRAARAPVRDLRPAAANLAKATPRLTDIGIEINRLGNMAAYNPGGANPPGSPTRDEGYLYWLAWLNHDANSVFQAADGVGFWRRFIVTQNCGTALSILAASPLAPVVSGLSPLSKLLSGNSGAPCN
jgi:phospholipid/cholesterol/gamma-HCH transport system substrate-binding protein